MKPARELRVPRQTSAILPSIHQKSNWPAVQGTQKPDFFGKVGLLICVAEFVRIPMRRLLVLGILTNSATSRHTLAGTGASAGVLPRGVDADFRFVLGRSFAATVGAAVPLTMTPRSWAPWVSSDSCVRCVTSRQVLPRRSTSSTASVWAATTHGSL